MFQYLLPVFSAFCRASNAMFGVCLDAFLTAITLALAISNEAYDNTQTHAHIHADREKETESLEWSQDSRKIKIKMKMKNSKETRQVFFIARL